MSSNNWITNKLINGKNSYFDINNGSPEPKENIENNILTDKETPTPKKGPTGDISNKLKNLKNFFVHKLSDVRVEIKNVTCSKIPDLKSKLLFERRIQNKTL